MYLRGSKGVRTPLKNHKNIGFLSNTGPDPLKSQSYQASIQCWIIIGTSAERHLMAFRWRANGDPLMVLFGSSLPSSTNKKKSVVKVGPLWCMREAMALVSLRIHLSLRCSLMRYVPNARALTHVAVVTENSAYADFCGLTNTGLGGLILGLWFYFREHPRVHRQFF